MKLSGDHIVFIGTGPLSLLKAYLVGQKNPAVKITLIEMGNRIGGAWYSDKSPKGYEIECGCHIWSYVPEVYDYLERELDIPLYELNPGAFFIGKLKVPYSLKNTINTYTYIGKNLLTARFHSLKKIKTDPVRRTKIFGKKNKYPKLGSPELVSRLSSKLEQNKNITILTETKATKIKISDQIEVTTLNGIITCDKIYLTSVSKIETISTPEKEIKIKSDKRDYIHFLFRLDKPLKKPLFYWRLMSDHIIHRISDISYQTNHEENLLLIGIKDASYEKYSEDELVEHCGNFMRKNKLIDKSSNMSRLKTHIYPTFYIHGQTGDEIRDLDSEQIQLLHSTDIMYGMYYMLQEEGLI